MSKRVTLSHPDLPGESITVSERSAAVHAVAGWVPVDAPVDAPVDDDPETFDPDNS